MNLYNVAKFPLFLIFIMSNGKEDLHVRFIRKTYFSQFLNWSLPIINLIPTFAINVILSLFNNNVNIFRLTILD